jgi:hypothetical protein
MSQSPSVIQGRSLADIAENMRPIFQYVSMRSVSANEMAGWLQAALGTRFIFRHLHRQNAVLVLEAARGHASGE